MRPFKKGFVLKCAEYGLDKAAAKELFKKLAGTPNTPAPNAPIPEPEGDWIDNIGKTNNIAATGKATGATPTPTGNSQRIGRSLQDGRCQRPPDGKGRGRPDRHGPDLAG